jgi:cytochrome c oxidase subunit I+III
MFITMLGDLTAFACLVFGYFFFWTSGSNFPPDPLPGPGTVWPVTAGLLLFAAWALMVASRHLNRKASGLPFYAALSAAGVLGLTGGGALFLGPWVSGMNPKDSAYNATVWVLTAWTITHIAAGFIMQGYCLARKLAGRMTARYDADISTVTLYWHFLVVTVLVTVGVIAGFPAVSSRAG